MKKFLTTLLSLLALTAAVQAQMPSVPELPWDTAVVRGVLPNGLTYYIQHNANPKDRAFFYIAQKVGSVQEEEDQRGLAHFLEHMCFNGSEHFTGNAIVNFCQRIGVRFGAHLNAYTAADRTVYNIDNVPTDDPANLDSCLYILYDWANALTLDPAEIDKERGVIHEEWRVRNSGFMRILERQLPNLMPGSKYGNRLPIGLMEVVDNFKPEVLRAYYEKWYRPDLQGIIVVGDIDVRQMEQKVKDIFGKIPAQPNAAKHEYFPVPDNSEPIIVFDKDKEVVSPIVEIMVKHDPVPREMNNTAVGVANQFVFYMITKMFNYRFSDLMQDAGTPFSSLEAEDGDFILASTKEALTVAYQPKDGKGDEAFRTAIREMRRAARYGFTDAEYKRAQADYNSSLDQAVEARKTIKSGQLVQEIVRHFLENYPKTNFDGRIQMQRQLGQMVPLQAVNMALQQLIGGLDTNLVVMGLYPEKEGIDVPANEAMTTLLAQAKQEEVKPYEAKVVDTQLLAQEPKPGKIAKELPADALGYKTLVLGNGVKVLYKQTDYDEARISFSATSPGGWAKLPTRDMDQVELFDEVMADNGLGRFNGNDLGKALTGRIVSIAPSLGHYSDNFSGSSSKKDLRTLFQLAYLYFTDVHYDTVNFRNVYKQQEQYLANRSANPLSALQDSVTVHVHGNNPRVQPFTLDRLKNVRYDEILRIYRERFANPADFTFYFTGAVNEDSIKALAAQYLGSLPTKGKAEKLTSDGVEMWKGVQTNRFGKKMETPQCYILQVWNGKCPFTAKNKVIAEALGDVLDMIYTETVREKYSFAYSTSTRCSLSKDINESFLLQTVAPVKPEKCDSALLVIDQGVEQIAREGVNAEHLAKIKEQMLKSYETNQRENRYWHSRIQTLLTTGTNLCEGEKEAIQGLTSDDVKDFLNKVVLKQKNKLNVIIEPQP